MGWTSMKKKDIINLIKYHVEQNNSAFRDVAYRIAREFDSGGDTQLAGYIMSLLSSANTFVTQGREVNLEFLKKIDYVNAALPLPIAIKDDIVGIINAVNHNMGINKFLFQGSPGTGKTETAKQVARILNRELFSVDFDELIDSRMGQTSKNIGHLFKEINNLTRPGHVVILFDEIDALALDRTSSNDIREMGRVTTSVLKGLDSLNNKTVLIATTNLFKSFDKALIRRFNSIIDFDRYSQDDLLEIAEIIMNNALDKFGGMSKDTRLFRKIIKLLDKLSYPGDLKNLIETSVAFSNPKDRYDYFRRLYQSITKKKPDNIDLLREQGFTIREIEILTQISKSTVARELR